MPTQSSDRSRALFEELQRPAARARLETELLPGYLVAQRWYGAKDGGRPAITLTATLAFGAGTPPALMTLVRAAPAGQAPQTYFVPLAEAAADQEVDPAAVVGNLRLDAREVRLVDAVSDDRFVRALLEGIRDAAAHPNGLTFRRTTAFRDPAPGAVPSIARVAAEQSNTSLGVGDAMLKVFRRVYAGVHPEIEMTGFLTERTAFRNAATLLGFVEWQTDGGPTVLCGLQTRIPNQGDGWTYAVEALTRIAPGGAPAEHRKVVALAAQLGRRTAELHRALAGPSDDPAFAPEPLTAAHLAQWAESVRAQAEAAFAGLRQAGARLAPSAGSLARRLLEREPGVAARVAALTAEPVEAWITRLHNDYHLGQVLVSGDDVFVIDFEGEPLRPLAERRAKHSVLRDVAGVLRSFGYAAAAAARRLEPEARIAAAPVLDASAHEMSRAFLDAYRRTMRGCPSFPVEVQARRLLELFLLEKAFYEIRYELANRPDWVEIPLAGVIALLEGSPSDAS